MEHLRARLGRLSERAITAADSEEEKLRKTLLIFASSLMGFAAILWLAIYWAMGIKFSSTVPLVYLALSAATLAGYLWSGNFEFFRFAQVSLFLFVPFVMQWSIGSFVTSSGASLWALLAPIGMTIFQSARASIPWFVAYVTLTAVSGFFDYYIGHDNRVSSLPMETIAVFFALNFAAMATIVYLLFGYFVSQRNRLQASLDEKHRLLVIEQEKSERLLMSVLPQKIAERLKQTHNVIADGHADVSVMFADIVNFTSLSEQLPPREIVTLLNEVFSEFDALTEKFNLEKIKTIGDAYMVAGGMNERPGYTEAIAEMALAARAIVARHEPLARRRLGVHIGISTGPVVAGVIGVTRFIYDLWGNTVNVASRLSSEAAGGQIMVDENTYKRLAHCFRFSGPTLVAVKGKGQMMIYQLHGRADPEEIDSERSPVAAHRQG
ncbi:MAG TPA: adenylate/guanylate cyclase domain-containing protein [Burkholderiales bacterium]|nr:adenylate/guanylate cyclase domain-containing protein [Burkholderiales bacterium]